MNSKTLRVLIALGFVLLLKIQDSSETEMPIKAVSGFFLEKLPATPLFYDNFVPMLFKFPLPHWVKHDLTLNVSQCDSPNFVKGSSCITTYYIPEVQRRFADYILSSQPSTFRSRAASVSIMEADLCGKIRLHFEPENGQLDSQALEHYLEALQSCSALRDHSFVKTISDYSHNIKEVYSTMAAGFRKEVWAKLPSDRIDAGLWSNAVSAMNALMFSNYDVEISRWHAAFRECSQGQIPNLLQPDEFQDSLRELLSSLSNSPFRPTFPPDCQMSCYNTKLSNCFFSEDYYAVRILIPVSLIAEPNLSFFRVKSGRFWLNGSQTCQHEPTTSLVLVDHNVNKAYNTKCEVGKLCHISSQLSPDNINTCVSFLFNVELAVDKFIEQCPLTCQQISPFASDTVVEQISPTEFIIGNVQGINSDVLVQCPNVEDTFLETVLTGSLLVKLPNQCRMYSNNRVFTSHVSEEDFNLTLTAIVPTHWVHPSVLESLVSENISESDPIISTSQLLVPNTEQTALPKIIQKSESIPAEILCLVIIFGGYAIISGLLITCLSLQVLKLHKNVAMLHNLNLNNSSGLKDVGNRGFVLTAVSNGHYDENIYEETDEAEYSQIF